ncbi:MAG TPA: hypothetical protein VFG71_05250 [Nitrospiraceae bacterium]|nr:hypothetical protein [Nitrospiraceae bacterium]
MNNLLAWIHLLAAISWIGGMIFLSLIVAPLFRRAGLSGERLQLFRDVALRFRILVWAAMGLLITTGVVLVAQRDLPLGAPTSWPAPLQIKLTLVVLLLAASLWHDLGLASRNRQTARRSAGETAVVDRTPAALARLLPRLALMLALAVVFAAVVLVRS